MHSLFHPTFHAAETIRIPTLQMSNLRLSESAKCQTGGLKAQL